MEQDLLAEQIARCQNGDREAIVWLVRQFGPQLYRYFLRMNNSTLDAEDLLQELFVKLIENIHQYRHEGRFEGWLFRVAANLVRNEARRRKIRGGVISLQDENKGLGDALASKEATACQKAQQTEQIDQLQEALRQLPSTDREIIILRHYGQLSFKEIAEHYQIPVGTALSKVHRGLKCLKEIIGSGPRG